MDLALCVRMLSVLGQADVNEIALRIDEQGSQGKDQRLMKVLVLGLDGATWDVLEPLASDGVLPNLARLRDQGVSGVAGLGIPAAESRGLDWCHDGQELGQAWRVRVPGVRDTTHSSQQVNSSRSIQADLLWEIAGRYGKKTVAGGVPMSYPPRPAKDFPGFYLGDFLSPEQAADFSSDPALFAELEREVGPYRPWSTTIHDGGNEAAVIDDLTAFLDQHLKTVLFLMSRCEWDLLIFDLMATDRLGHELWHVWDLTHRAARGRERQLAALRPRLLEFWKTLDRGVGAIHDKLPADASLLLMSDHGFGPIEWYVNFNVWLLEQGFIALDDSAYVKQKYWCYRHGVTPEWIYNVMSRLGWQDTASAGSGVSSRALWIDWVSRSSCRGGTSTGRGREPIPRATSVRSSSTSRDGSPGVASRLKTLARSSRI